MLQYVWEFVPPALCLGHFGAISMLSSLEWSVDPFKLFLLMPASHFQTPESMNICFLFFKINSLNK